MTEKSVMEGRIHAMDARIGTLPAQIAAISRSFWDGKQSRRKSEKIVLHIGKAPGTGKKHTNRPIR